MVEWLLEYKGQTKPLAEIRAPELRYFIEPVYDHLAKALSLLRDEELLGLNVIIYFGDDASLKFRLQGPTAVVDAARNEIGDHGEISTIRH